MTVSKRYLRLISRRLHLVNTSCRQEACLRTDRDAAGRIAPGKGGKLSGPGSRPHLGGHQGFLLIGPVANHAAYKGMHSPWSSPQASVRHRPDWSNFRYGRVGSGCTQTDQKVCSGRIPTFPMSTLDGRPSHPQKVEVSYSIQSACAQWIRQPPRPLTDRLQSIVIGWKSSPL
jgi:hypothetical protein